MAYFRKYRRLNNELTKLVNEDSDSSNESIAGTHTNEGFVDLEGSVISENESNLSDGFENELYEFDLDDNIPPLISDDEEYPEDSENDILGLKTGLVDLSCNYNLPRACMNDLLSVLRANGHADLPKDSRTLKGTPRGIAYEQKCGGEYLYLGIEKSVIKQLDRSNLPLDHNSIDLIINIDGLPIFKSSKVQLWPILGKFDNSDVFPIALYSGKSKPDNVTDYLNDLITEINMLCLEGIDYGDINYAVTVKAFICDAPARAFLKCIIGHTGYNACERCEIRGSRDTNRTVYNEDVDFCSRNKDGFNQLLYQGLHQSSLSPLVELMDFDCIIGFILDYMHLVCLGVTKRILLFLKSGPRICKLSNAQFMEISNKLVSLNGKLPTDFARQPRSLNDLAFWKATEYRQFLLYTGPIVLKGIVSEATYRHFLTFSIAMRILLNEDIVFRNRYLEYAKELLTYFCRKSKFIYGSTFCVYNVHCLLHLQEDVRNYGCSLNGISAFPFENYMQIFKKFIKNAKSPIVQVAKRLAELENAVNITKKNQHSIIISTRFRDSLFKLDGNSYCFIKEKNGENYVCDTFNATQLVALFDSPIDSRTVEVGCIPDINCMHFSRELIHKSRLIKKAAVLPYKTGYVCILLVHDFK